MFLVVLVMFWGMQPCAIRAGHGKLAFGLIVRPLTASPAACGGGRGLHTEVCMCDQLLIPCFFVEQNKAKLSLACLGSSD